MNRYAPAAILAITLCIATLSRADEPAITETVDYLRDVKQVLKQRCYACHGALKQEAGLRLDTMQAMRKGGDSGAAIAPGEPTDSLIIERVTSSDEFTRMPPEGEPLEPEQIDNLRRWLQAGAVAPLDELPEADPRSHWAFVPPGRVELSPGDLASENPVDLLLNEQRQRHGIQTAGQVDRSLLLRRVYLDLIGLPPTREQLQAFLADDRSDAYERVVQELLDSPHYGERWGRHWMDVWRYTDWFGLGQQLRYSQKHIWHWRDWIVESLNTDRGYDQMVLEMLAADEIAPTDANTLRATGFLARNYFLFNRTTWLDNTIEHTSKAFLGLTMNCAKCHDHKYDPILQTDYYRLRAVFEPHQVRLDPVVGETDLEQNGLPRVFDAHPEAATYVHVRGDEKSPDKSRRMEPGVPGWLGTADFEAAPLSLPPEGHFPSLQWFVLEDRTREANLQIEEARKSVQSAERALEAAKRAALAAGSGEQASKPGELVLSDEFEQPREDQWVQGPGTWKYESGRVIQSETGATRRYLRSTKTHPDDFIATLRFRTTGGDKWKSVGICFDAVDGREKMVYLSAVQPGSKLQVSFNQGTGPVYPPSARQDRAVPLNESIELQIAVRGKLINAFVNGDHALAFQLPVERETGHIDLVAFDAIAEFDSFELRVLPPDFAMRRPGTDGATPLTVPQSKLALRIAQAKLNVSELRPAALQTAHAADRARHGLTPTRNAGNQLLVDELVRQAALAARKLAAAEAALAVATEEKNLAEATGDNRSAIEKKLAEAQQRFEQAQAAIEKPGEAYTSLRVSSKAAEGPDEPENSRRQPYPDTSTGRRTALARWIIHRENPLTARVAVNHIWTRHFGQPLVDSTFDFGLRAPQPKQQALLDWLAVELMENGWSMKHLHRLLVTSQAYRLTSSISQADSATVNGDPGNQYYWRRRAVRMQSQVVRDSVLHLAGSLDLKLGGPTIDPNSKVSTYRRSIYFTHSRDSRDRFLSMFDDADILACYRRSESIVPQQALAMANSALSLDMSRRIADRLQATLDSDAGPTSSTPAPADSDSATSHTEDSFITAAFEAVLCRLPSDDELSACREALAAWLLEAGDPVSSESAARARGHLVHALLNHNDFVTIR